MEEIYASLSQTGNTLDDAARIDGPLLGPKRNRQSSAELGSQEYLDGLRKSQEAVARTSFRRPKIGDNAFKDKIGSGAGAKFEHLGKTSYRFGPHSTAQNPNGASASSDVAAGAELPRKKTAELSKKPKLSKKPAETRRENIAKEKFKVTIRTDRTRNAATTHDSSDSSDELNLTSSSQPIQSPKKLYMFSDAGGAPPESDSDDHDIHKGLTLLASSRKTLPMPAEKSKLRSSRSRSRHDENSFSDETPQKKLRVKPLVAYTRNSSSLQDGGFSSSPRKRKGNKSRFGTSRSANSYQPEIDGMGEEETPRLKRLNAKKKPAPFPMTELAASNDGRPVTKENEKRRPAPFPMSIDLADDCTPGGCDRNGRDSSSDEDPLLMSRNDEIINRGGLAPFPMSLDNRPPPSDSEYSKEPISSTDESGCHILGQAKREPNRTRDVSDTIERSFTQAGYQPDPETLCPYCDMPFPPNPTPLLLDMLKRIPRYPDPRPTNPSGLKAPLLSYVSMCQRHQFEMQLLPKARAAAWPTYIDFAALPGRIYALQQHMTAVLMDKEKSVFWRELKKQIDKQGARKTMGITNQFDSFERSQPGYYGEQGAVIITQALSNLFPPDSLDSNRVAPLTPMEFIRCVLVPECAVALIQEDLGSGTSIEYAVRTLRKSSKYGTAMFPDLDNRDAMSVGEDSRAGQQVGEAIVKERVRARRVEISEEEREVEETRAAPAEINGRKNMTNKQHTKAKAAAFPAKNNRTGHTVELSDSSSVPTDTPRRRRKRCGLKHSGSNAAAPLETSSKHSGKKASRLKVKARPTVASHTTVDPVYSGSESLRSDMDERTPRPRVRTREPYESDSGIVLPDEDNRYEKSSERNSRTSKTSKLTGSFLPLQAAKARKPEKEAVFKWRMWENDDESDTSANTSETGASHKRRATALGRTESHSWLFSDPSSSGSTPQR